MVKCKVNCVGLKIPGEEFRDISFHMRPQNQTHWHLAIFYFILLLDISHDSDTLRNIDCIRITKPLSHIAFSETSVKVLPLQPPEILIHWTSSTYYISVHLGYPNHAGRRNTWRRRADFKYRCAPGRSDGLGQTGIVDFYDSNARKKIIALLAWFFSITWALLFLLIGVYGIVELFWNQCAAYRFYKCFQKGILTSGCTIFFHFSILNQDFHDYQDCLDLLF